MTTDRIEKLKLKLSYISKSKKGTFESCPKAFYYNYVSEGDEEQAENPYFILGIDVHDFIDEFFDIISIDEGGIMTDLDKLKFHPNTPYKKNVAKFELERWEACKKAVKDETYFYPTVKEKRWTTESPRLIGIVDRVHKCFAGDIFAPRCPNSKGKLGKTTDPIHPEFKDGDLVIVENKTGMPNAEKCRNYEEDMLWYKIIMEIVQPELAPIRWGAIYFPFDNYVYRCELKIEDCKVLAKEIKEVREAIQQNLETGMWPATPSSYACQWCGYKNECPSVYRKKR